MSIDHYENFPVASILLPRHLRQPITVIYRFARTADDFADEGNLPDAERLRLLNEYHEKLNRLERGETPPPGLFSNLAHIIHQHNLPFQLFHDLLDAFSQDVVRKRYASFSEVLDYCRRSANPIGRLLLHLYERATPQHLIWSDAICSALQIINFWQDIAVDWKKDRVYLPQESMAQYGVTEQHIAAAISDDAWRALLKFEVDRARAMIKSGAPLALALPGRIGWELRLVVQGGLRILEKIEHVQYDVFRKRPVLTTCDRLLMVARSFSM